MTPSLENRQRIALLVFFVGDHLLWYYGGHFEQASLFYVVVSEIVRLIALLAIFTSYFYDKFIEQSLVLVMVYCFVLIPLNLNGASDYSIKYKEVTPNLLWFKRDSEIAIEHAFYAFLLYILFLLVLYCFVFKHTKLPNIKDE